MPWPRTIRTRRENPPLNPTDLHALPSPSPPSHQLYPAHGRTPVYVETLPTNRVPCEHLIRGGRCHAGHKHLHTYSRHRNENVIIRAVGRDRMTSKSGPNWRGRRERIRE